MSITEGLIAYVMYWKDCACIERKRGRAILKEAQAWRTVARLNARRARKDLEERARLKAKLRAARREIEILKSSGETVNTVKDVTIKITSFEKGTFVEDEDFKELLIGDTPNIKTQQVIEDIEAGRNLVGPFDSEKQFFKELEEKTND